MSSVKHPFIPYAAPRYTEEQTIEKAKEFYEYMNLRRSVREFSDRDVPKEVIENIVMTAGT